MRLVGGGAIQDFLTTPSLRSCLPYGIRLHAFMDLQELVVAPRDSTPRLQFPTIFYNLILNKYILLPIFICIVCWIL